MDIILTSYYILGSSALLGAFIPFFIYLKYGREPKIDYNAKYETDLPTDDPPAIVNAICGDILKEVGKPDINGFKATIMDLIDRNYLILEDMHNDNEDLDSSAPLFLKVNPNNDFTTLWNFEARVLSFLRSYEQDGVISMKVISESLYFNNAKFSKSAYYYDSADFFRSTYSRWADEVKRTLLEDGKLKEAFLRKGNTYLKIFGIFGLIIVTVTLFVLFSTSADPVHTARYVLISSIILGISAIISILTPEKIAGRWTTYGKEYYAQWHSFKRYIEDYSFIKEYSPESVHVWNKYLVYATALGAADGIKKAMKLSIPESRFSKLFLKAFKIL